jgi:hypothetical protein
MRRPPRRWSRSDVRGITGELYGHAPVTRNAGAASHDRLRIGRVDRQPQDARARGTSNACRRRRSRAGPALATGEDALVPRNRESEQGAADLAREEMEVLFAIVGGLQAGPWSLAADSKWGSGSTTPGGAW